MNRAPNSNEARDPNGLAAKHGRIWIWMSLFGCMVAGIWFASRSMQWTSAEASAETKPANIRSLPVNVQEIQYVTGITQSRSYTGTVRAKKRSDLGFEMTGKLLDVFVEEGDSVSEGTPLATLDTATLSAQKNAILAGIEQTRALLTELESGPRAETINAARSARDAARSQMELAQSGLERRKSLFDQGAISHEEFDTARFGLQTAAANLKSTQDQLAELEAGTRNEQLDAQRSALRQREASLKEIEVAILKSSLLAPFPGTITERYLDPGSIASASTPVVRLVAEQELESWIGLPVEVVAGLEIGDEHSIKVANQTYDASIVAKIKELDMITRTQTVVLKLDPAASRKVVSGQLCEMNISSQTTAEGYWIPHAALSKGMRGLWSVFVVASEQTGSNGNPGSNRVVFQGRYRVEKRDIEILHTETSRVLVRGTLEAGDWIVIDGVHRIANGQWVEPMEAVKQ